MRPLKTNGMQELQALRKRVFSARALGRISEVDASYIIEHLAHVEARVVSMTETDEDGREVG